MMQNLDIFIFRWFNSWVGVNPFWDALIIFRAVYLWYVVLVGVALFVVFALLPKYRMYFKKNTEMVLLAAASAFTARFVAAELIRLFFYRPRPYMALEGVQVLQHQLLGNMATSGSFPSGHASLAFVVATAISFYHPKTSILFFLAAVSIGGGRIAAGTHWPSDIVGGAIVGIATAFLLRFLFGRLWPKRR